MPENIEMKKLSDDIKRALNALAYQDATEFLSTREKLDVLGYGNKKVRHPLIPRQNTQKIETPKRIGLVVDTRSNSVPLDYAIDACKRQGKNTHIDILIHGSMRTETTTSLEKRIKQAGLEFQLIKLGENAVESLISYIKNYPSLIFLISMPDDVITRALIEEVMPNSGEHIQVPVVLIEGNTSATYQKKSAA